MSYTSLSDSYYKSICNYSSIREPYSYAEPMHDKKCVAAMNQELQALTDNKTWILVDLPTGKRDIGYKWIYKVKYNAQREVDRYKARLVAKGYTQ